MRLIDADELKKVIFSKSDNMEDLWDTAGVLNAINNAPTVITNSIYEALCTITDAEFEHSNGFWIITPKGKKINFEKARPTGEWINHYDDLFPAESTEECSICHQEQSIGNDDNYCPNCGAKMKGAEK